MRNRIATTLFFALLLGVSSESHAFLEWLHKLSGPGPFVGLKLSGRFHCDLKPSCDLVEIAGGSGFVETRPRWTGNLNFGVDFSYENDLDYPVGVSAPQVWIWSLEPAVELWLTEDRDTYVGLGYAFSDFQGSGFTDFRRDAVVARVGHRWDRDGHKIHAWELGVKYFYFEDHFRPSDFGAIGDEEEERGVVGFFLKAFFWKRSP